MEDLNIIISLLSTVLLILPICYFLFYIKFKSDDKVEEMPIEVEDISDTDPESEEEQRGLQGQIKQNKLKNLQKQLTAEQKLQEKIMEAKQIEQIYRLLQEQQNLLSAEEVEEQLNLYR